MAKNTQRSKDPVNSGYTGHVRPETKPIINSGVAGGVSPKQIGVDSSPGIVSPESVPAGQQS